MINIDDIIQLLKATKTKDNELSHKHTIAYINLAWILVILILVVIFLLSEKITAYNCPNIVQFVTNFSTLLSIILSISSILYAYYTSRDTGNQYTEMGKALEEVRAANLHIMLNNSNIVSQVNEIAKEVSVLNSKYDLQTLLSNNNQSSKSSELELNSIKISNAKYLDNTNKSQIKE